MDERKKERLKGSGTGNVSPDAADLTRKDQEPVVMLAFTSRGADTMDRLAAALSEHFPDMEIRTAVRSKMMPERSIKESAEDFTGRWFTRSRAMIYFGATGIAVRSIAPFVRDKFRDPAVLVLDESGIFCISLLSGHVGGGNELCRICADLIGAVPVITTATDGRGQFAVDVFAVHHNLAIGERTAAKDVSARLLAGETLKVYLDEDGNGSGQNQVEKTDAELNGKNSAQNIRTELAAFPQLLMTEERSVADILISARRVPTDKPTALHLYPRCLFLGIGCRRGTEEAAIDREVRKVLEAERYALEAVHAVASIDLKKDEPGLNAFCKTHKLPFFTASARELMAVPGAFSSSDFVRKITGADNVCERSAVWIARKIRDEDDRRRRFGQGSVESGAAPGEKSGAHLVVRKTAGEGVTVAAAVI